MSALFLIEQVVVGKKVLGVNIEQELIFQNKVIDRVGRRPRKE